MFTAYFDASGARDMRGITVAGFVSRSHKWAKFQAAWLAALPPGISLFHMTDFVSSKSGWEQWRGKSRERAQFIECLVTIIRNHTNKGFATTVMSRHYQEANKEFRILEEHGPPYVICGIAALSQLKQWALRKHIHHGRIKCVFERGDADWPLLKKLATTDGFDVEDEDKKLNRAFDACDLAAWRARIIMDDTFTASSILGREKDGERIMKALRQLQSIVADNGMLRTKGLKRVCTSLGISQRQTACQSRL